MDRREAGTETSHDVFVSYAREDEAAAKLLKQRLQQLGRRWFQLQAMKVFLDSTDLIGADSLWGKIAKELENSRHLLLLVSQAGSKSTYVLRELNHFAERNPVDRVTVVLLDDPAPWAGRGNDNVSIDDPLRERLRELFRDEPHYVDLRNVDLTSFELTDQSVRSTVAQISAPILGVDKDALADQEYDRQKFRVRVRNAAIGVLAGLLAGVVFLAVQANANADRADENAELAGERAKEAEENAELAEQNAQEAIENAEEARRAQAESDSQRVALVSESLLSADPELAALLAIEALTLTPTQEAVDAAGRALLASNTIGVSALADKQGGPIVRPGPEETLITVGRSGVVQQWTADLSAPPTVLVELDRPVTTLDLLDGGQLLAAGHPDGTISVWGADSPEILEISAHRGAVNSVRFVDGGTVASGGADNAVRLWSVPELTQVGDDLRGHDLSVLMVAPSPDGKQIATAGAGGKLLLWSLDSGEPPERLEDGEVPVGAVAWSESGLLLAWSVDRSVQVLDRSDNTQQRGQAHDDFVTSLAFSADDRFLLSGAEDSTVRLWNTDTFAPVGRALSGPRSEVLAVEFAQNDERVVATSQDGAIRSWAVDDPRQASVAFLPSDSDAIGAVSIHPDGSMVATSGSNGFRSIAYLWNPFDLEPIRDLSSLGELVFSLAFSPDGETLATGGPSLVQLYDLESQQITEVEVNGLVSADFLSWAPNGRHLVVADLQGRAHLVEPSSESVPAWWFDPRLAKVTAIRFVDDETIALANDEGVLRVLTVPEMEVAHEVQTPEVISALTVAPSGEELFAVTAGTGSLLTYQTADLSLVRSEPTARHPGGLRGVAVSPGGDRLVTAGFDGELQIWSAETGRKIGESIPAFATAANRIDYARDGQFIVSTSGDGTAIVWPTDSNELIRRLCSATGRTLTAEEWSLYVGPNVVRPEESPCPGEPLADGDEEQTSLAGLAEPLPLYPVDGMAPEGSELPPVVGLRLVVGLFALQQAELTAELVCGDGSVTIVDEFIDQMLFSFNPPENIIGIEEVSPGVMRITTDGDACNFRFRELAGGRR